MRILTLGQKINTLRSEIGLTQKELAAQLDITTGTIAEWESDESTPSLAELSRLSKALNVSSDVLLDTTTEERPSPVAQPKQEPISVVAPVKKRKKTGLIIGAAVVLVALVIGALFLFKSIPFSENAAAIEAADASVVTIFCYDYEGELAATGSGFVAYDSKTIITNYHVMTSAYTCKVSTNQDISYDVTEIVVYSKEKDIAILQLAEDTGLIPLTFGDSTAIKKGENVVAIGSPLGIKNTVSTGVLSGRLMEENMDVLQFTAPISSGSSGGALFNDSGSVIGITFASYDNGQNLNLAIPINEVVTLYNLKNRYRPKDINYIFLEEHPLYNYLKKYKNAVEVSIEDLKRNPSEYDGKYIKLKAIVLSGDNNTQYMFLTNRKDLLPGVLSIDLAMQKIMNFEEMHSIAVIQGYECEYCAENIDTGNTVVVIGEFLYDAIGEAYKSYANGEFVTLTREINYAVLRARLIYFPD